MICLYTWGNNGYDLIKNCVTDSLLNVWATSKYIHNNVVLFIKKQTNKQTNKTNRI